jgi:hypothetical protein
MEPVESTPSHDRSWYEEEFRRTPEYDRRTREENLLKDVLFNLGIGIVDSVMEEWRRAKDAEEEARFIGLLRNPSPQETDYADRPELREIWGQWLGHGPAVYPRKFVRELAHRLWEEAGKPDGRAVEFWFAAEKIMDKRGFAIAGFGGFCPTDSRLAKEEAIKQFCRRREHAIKHGQIENSSLPAGYPLYFYCNFCGILLETLPEDYLFRPRRQCSQCKGLSELRWLDDAKDAAEKAGLSLPVKMMYTPK